MYQLIANRLFKFWHKQFRQQRLGYLIRLPILCCLLISPLQAAQQGLLYQFQKPGGEVHYLFGTMHATDPRVLEILEHIEESLAKSSQLVMEMVPDISAMLSSGASMMLPDGQTLQQLLGDELYAKVLAAVTDKGLTDAILQHFKPWAVAVTISIPELQGAFLDQRIYQLALANGQAVYGLETAAEQLAIFDGLDQSLQVKMLQETLQQLPEFPAMFDSMVNAYIARDLAALQQLTLEYELSSSDEALADWFRQELIEKRNIRMAERLEKLLEQGTSFVAVGALHLVDDSGLIKALQRAGYQVNPIY